MNQDSLVLAILNAVDDLAASKSGRKTTSYTFEPRYTYQITLLDYEGKHYGSLTKYSHLPLDEFKTATDENIRLIKSQGGLNRVHSFTVTCIGVRFPQESEK